MKTLIQRAINIEDCIEKGKVLIIYGPRQVGKTTIITSFLQHFKGKYRTYTGDSITTQEIFSSQRLERLKEHVEGLDLLFIDEAQNIKNIGINQTKLKESGSQNYLRSYHGLDSEGIVKFIKQNL